MEKITDIELTSIVTKSSSFLNEATSTILQEEDVETPYGNIRVSIQGDRSRPAILTFHDIGLNHMTSFQSFFNFPDMQLLLRYFCVYHVNAPGQEENALHLKPKHDALGNPESLGCGFVYPSMDQLAEAVHCVVMYYCLKSIIGFGVGAGANVMARYELSHHDYVDSLVLVNAHASQAGWIEWAYQKMNAWYLLGGKLTKFTEDYLLWHWFGKYVRWQNNDLVLMYQEYIKCLNCQNLALFIQSYLKRSDLEVVRQIDPSLRASSRCIRCRTLMLVGDDSPHLDDVVEMNGRMLPGETDFVKLADCGGMPLEEQPGKVCEAFRLFLQGMGYVPSLVYLRSAAGVASLHTMHGAEVGQMPAVC